MSNSLLIVRLIFNNDGGVGSGRTRRDWRAGCMRMQWKSIPAPGRVGQTSMGLRPPARKKADNSNHWLHSFLFVCSLLETEGFGYPRWESSFVCPTPRPTLGLSVSPFLHPYAKHWATMYPQITLTRTGVRRHPLTHPLPTQWVGTYLTSPDVFGIVKWVQGARLTSHTNWLTAPQPMAAHPTTALPEAGGGEVPGGPLGAGPFTAITNEYSILWPRKLVGQGRLVKEGWNTYDQEPLHNKESSVFGEPPPKAKRREDGTVCAGGFFPHRFQWGWFDQGCLGGKKNEWISG